MENVWQAKVDQFRTEFNPNDRASFSYRFIQLIWEARFIYCDSRMEQQLFAFLENQAQKFSLDSELLDLIELVLQLFPQTLPPTEEPSPLLAPGAMDLQKVYSCLIWSFNNDEFQKSIQIPPIENSDFDGKVHIKPGSFPLYQPFFWPKIIKALIEFASRCPDGRFQNEFRDLLVLSELRLLRKILQPTEKIFFWSTIWQPFDWFKCHPESLSATGVPFTKSHAEFDPLVLRAFSPRYKMTLSDGMQPGTRLLVTGCAGCGKTAGAIWLTSESLKGVLNKGPMTSVFRREAPFPVFMQAEELPELIDILTQISSTFIYCLSAEPAEFWPDNDPQRFAILQIFCRCFATLEELLNRLRTAGLWMAGDGKRIIDYIMDNYAAANMGRPAYPETYDRGLPTLAPILQAALPRGFKRLHIILDWIGQLLPPARVQEAREIQRQLQKYHLGSTFFIASEAAAAPELLEQEGDLEEGDMSLDLNPFWLENDKENLKAVYSLRFQECKLRSLQFLLDPSLFGGVDIHEGLIRNAQTPRKMVELGAELIRTADRKKDHFLTGAEIKKIIP